MKRKSTLLVLTLALMLVITSFQGVFAETAAPNDATKAAIEKTAVHSILDVEAASTVVGTSTVINEVVAEKVAKKLTEEVLAGGYKLMDTETLKGKLGKVVIIDTMPQGWYDSVHIPGAICSVAGVEKPEFKMTSDQKKALLKAAKKAVGTKKVTKWYNKKTKKWTTKKPAKKYRGKSKKVSVVNKNKTIVTYCGFVGCRRSDQAAKYLVSKGFKNVYRYAGGIAAWVDAGYDVEGTQVFDF